MSVRISIAAILVVFAYPFWSVVNSIDVEPALKLFAVVGYFIDVVYLTATGFNLMNKGKSW